MVREDGGRHARLAHGGGRIGEVGAGDRREERDGLEAAVREEEHLAPVLVARKFDVGAAEHLLAALRAVEDPGFGLHALDGLVVDVVVPELDRRFSRGAGGGQKKSGNEAELAHAGSPEIGRK